MSVCFELLGIAMLGQKETIAFDETGFSSPLSISICQNAQSAFYVKPQMSSY